MNRRQMLLGAAALAACSPAASGVTSKPFPMRRGVNLGNALEAPNEGEWGYRIEPEHLAAIKDAGFDGVRLPVRWDAHMGARAPYTIEPAFLARVDDVVSDALARELFVQLDDHHDEGLIADPSAGLERFRELWRQLSAHFAAAPAKLLFEPLNEPHGDAWTAHKTSEVLAAALEEIRAHHPDRLVVLGGPNWNSVDGLRGWRPPGDPNVAVTVHYYEPHDFTHAEAPWLGADAPHFDRAWGTDVDQRQVRDHAARAARQAAANGLALQLGEFGVNAAVPVAQRALWTRCVREAFEAEGAGWCVWDFAGAFPIWDLARGAFVPEMLDALLH